MTDDYQNIGFDQLPGAVSALFGRLDKIEGLINGSINSGKQSQKADSEIIDRVELCKRLQITVPTVIRWEKKDKIPSFRIGSSVRYDWAAVVESLTKKKR